MKKLILSIVMLSYLVVTCGVIFNYHYCMNRLASVNVYISHDDQCGRCGMDISESNGCCRDEMTIVKMVEDQNNSVVDSYSIPSLEPVPLLFAGFQIASYEANQIGNHFQNHSPPLLSAQDTYLRNGVFRI